MRKYSFEVRRPVEMIHTYHVAASSSLEASEIIAQQKAEPGSTLCHDGDLEIYCRVYCPHCNWINLIEAMPSEPIVTPANCCLKCDHCENQFRFPGIDSEICAFCSMRHRCVGLAEGVHVGAYDDLV